MEVQRPLGTPLMCSPWLTHEAVQICCGLWRTPREQLCGVGEGNELVVRQQHWA